MAITIKSGDGTIPVSSSYKGKQVKTCEGYDATFKLIKTFAGDEEYFLVNIRYTDKGYIIPRKGTTKYYGTTPYYLADITDWENKRDFFLRPAIDKILKESALS